MARKNKVDINSKTSILRSVLAGLGVSGALSFVRAEEIDSEDLKELEEVGVLRDPVVRLSLGLHRMDLLKTGLCVYRTSNGKVRYPSFARHALVPLTDDRATIKIEALGNFPFSKGVTAIMAGGGVGKTPLLKQFKRAFENQGLPAHLTLFGETRGEYTTDYFDLLTEIMTALWNGEHLFLDSLKNPVYDLPGGLATGGVATSLWPTLSDLSSVFDRLGLCMVTLVNPSSDDVKVISNAVQALKSNTNGIITSAVKGEWAGMYREIADEERLIFEFKASKEAFEYGGTTVLASSDAPLEPSVEDRISEPAVVKFDAVLAEALSKLF